MREWLERDWARSGERIVAVTTEGRGDLFALAQKQDYRTFPIPENVGGRFSVLSRGGPGAGGADRRSISAS